MAITTWQELIEASFDERISFLKANLIKAIDIALVADAALIAVGAHEQAVCHRIAFYLETLLPERAKVPPDPLAEDWITVDCEYNRYGGDPKTFAPDVGKLPKKFRPDILVHSRLYAENNLVAVEAKPLGTPKREREKDKKRIEKLVNEGKYAYKLGAVITICSTKGYIKKKKQAAITISWYTKTDGWTEEETLSKPMSEQLRQVAKRRKR